MHHAPFLMVKVSPETVHMSELIFPLPIKPMLNKTSRHAKQRRNVDCVSSDCYCL